MAAQTIEHAETVTVVVHPSGSDKESLTVADAMQQVLDVFALLSKAEGVVGSPVEWRLESASTNSPLTISATPYVAAPSTTLPAVAKQRLRDAWDGFLATGRRASWFDHETEVIVERLVKRNLNGIGRTDIQLDYGLPPLVIDYESAERAKKLLQQFRLEAVVEDDLTRTDYGSIEGTIDYVKSYRNKPAIRVKDWLSGRIITCIPRSKELADQINEEHRFADAWQNQRVVITGLIFYNRNGSIRRLDFDDIQKVQARLVSLEELRTGAPNKDTGDYLDWGDRNGH